MGQFYCRICNVRKVANDGDVCSSCNDPYQQPVAASPFATPAQEPANSTNTSDESNDGGASIQHRSSRRLLNVPGSSSAQQSSSKRQIMSQNSGAPVQSSPMSNAPVVQSVPQNAPAKTQGKHAPQAEGVVRNIQESQDRTPVLGRWFQALLGHTPFTTAPDMMEFQVFNGWSSGAQVQNSAYSADKIIVYGRIKSGKPIQDNSVRIYGTRLRNNAIVASVIENTTDGTTTEFDPPPLSPTVVRVITFGLLGLVVLLMMLLGSSFGSGPSLAGFGDAIGGFLMSLVLTIASGVCAWFCLKKLFSAMKSQSTDQLITYLIFLIVSVVVFLDFLAQLF